MKREKDAEIFAVWHKTSDIKKEIKYVASEDIKKDSKDLNPNEIVDTLPYTNAVHFFFTKTGRSTLIPLVIDLNSETTFAKTWKCWAIHCWFRKNYRPTKGINKIEVLRKNYASGYIKGTVHESESINPISSISMKGNINGVNRL